MIPHVAAVLARDVELAVQAAEGLAPNDRVDPLARGTLTASCPAEQPLGPILCAAVRASEPSESLADGRRLIRLQGSRHPAPGRSAGRSELQEAIHG